MTHTASITAGLIVYLVVAGLLHATAQAKANKSGDTLVYGPTPAVRWLLIIALLGTACAAIYISLAAPVSRIHALFFTVVTVVGTWAFPSTILANAEGIREVKWWGNRGRVEWKDVSRIEYHAGSSRIVVLDKEGNRVSHSSWISDAQGFLTLCQQKTGLVVNESKF